MPACPPSSKVPPWFLFQHGPWASLCLVMSAPTGVRMVIFRLPGRAPGLAAASLFPIGDDSLHAHGQTTATACVCRCVVWRVAFAKLHVPSAVSNAVHACALRCLVRAALSHMLGVTG